MDIKKEYERWLENATADANVAAELKTLDNAKIEDKDDMDTDSVLSLMDMFAIPYKATVLRLYESNCIKRHKAEELFCVTAEDVEKRVELTGKAKRWQLDGSGTESFGTLLEKADYNTEHDYLTESREKEDWKYISELKKELGMD